MQEAEKELTLQTEFAKLLMNTEIKNINCSHSDDNLTERSQGMDNNETNTEMRNCLVHRQMWPVSGYRNWYKWHCIKIVVVPES